MTLTHHTAPLRLLIDNHTARLWTPALPEEGHVFSPDDPHLALCLAPFVHSRCHVVLDLDGETLVHERLPKLNWRDRAQLAKVRQTRAFGDSPVAHAEWGRVVDGKRALVCCGLADPSPVTRWLTQLEQADITVASVHSVTLLAPALTGQPLEGTVLLLLPGHGQGLRLIFLQDGLPLYTRTIEPDGKYITAPQLDAELRLVLLYLRGERLYLDGDALAVYAMVGHALPLECVNQLAPLPDSTLTTLAMGSVEQRLWWLAKRRKSHFSAHLTATHTEHQHRLRAKQGAWVLGLLGGVVGLAYLLNGVWLLRESQATEARIYTMQHETRQLQARVPANTPAAADMASAVENMLALTTRWPSVNQGQQWVDTALQQHPALRLVGFDWSVAERQPPGTPAEGKLRLVGAAHVPYRAQLQQLTELLAQLNQTGQAKVQHYPLDIQPQGTLSDSGERASKTPEAFVLSVRFPLPPLPVEHRP